MSKTPKTESTRRSFLGGASAIAASASLAPLIVNRRAAAQARTLYINTWGGSWTAAEDAAFFKPFTEATGIRIRAIEPVSFAKIKAQVTSGNYEFDVTEINQSQWLRAQRDGLTAPIDWSVVNKEQLPPHAEYADGIAYCLLSTNLCYRTDKFPNGGPRNWADFWDVQKFPGARALGSGDPQRNLVFALLADGVPRDKIYPLDIDRAFRKLDQIKPHIKVWWTQGNQQQQLIRDGEVDLMSIWNARASELKQQGTPVELVWDGALDSVVMWGVVKGAPNANAGWRFIQSAIQPQPQAAFSKRLFYGPSNPKAFEFIPPDVAANLPGSTEHASLSVKTDPVWEADNVAKIEERFTQWLAS